MRRLNNAEYQNTLQDLFGSSVTSAGFPDEGRTEGFDTLASALAVSPLHIDSYLAAADQVVSELFDHDPAGLRAGFCDYQTGDTAANLGCAKQIVSGFATRAFRRAATAWPDGQPDVDYTGLLDKTGPLGALSLDLRLKTALQAVLVSPRFVFRVELTDAGGNLDTPSLASRLSYFLWSSAPDSELLASDLQQTNVLADQVQRLQASDHFARFLSRFPKMWLELEKLDVAEKDPDVYPAFNDALRVAMSKETLDFFASFYRDPSARIDSLLLAAPAPSGTPLLAKLYGDSPRLGLVTQASIMTLTGASNRTSAVRRGKWVLERLLCAPPPPPPAAAVALAAVPPDPSLTEKERLERHRVNPTCAACHDVMDPIGLGFENYDAIGAYRTTDTSGKPIVASGELKNVGAFAGPLELIGLLAQDPRVPACIAQQLLTYGTGRTYDGADDALIQQVRAAAGGDAASFQSVLSAAVQSAAFRRRD